MFPTFGLTLILMVPTAPVPKNIPPVGPAPYILNLKADDDGNISFPVTRSRKRIVIATTTFQGGVRFENVIIDFGKGTVDVGLADLKDLKVYTAYGQEMSMLEAIRKLENNLRVVVSSDEIGRAHV